MLANNETGVVQPIGEFGQALARASHTHCGAVQAAGKLAFDIHGLGVDYLSLSAHKLGGPTGWRADRLQANPLASDRLGGGRKPIGAPARRMWPVLQAGAAAEIPRSSLAVAPLRDRLEATLLRFAPDARVFWRRRAAPRQHGAASLPGVKAETQVMALDLAGVCVSAGAACSSGKVQRSAVLDAMGVVPADAANTQSGSLGLEPGKRH